MANSQATNGVAKTSHTTTTRSTKRAPSTLRSLPAASQSSSTSWQRAGCHKGVLSEAVPVGTRESSPKQKTGLSSAGSIALATSRT